jgi:hypothetical protein
MKCTCAILWSVACPAVLYFSTLSHKQHDFQPKVMEHKICVSISCTAFLWNISHSRKNWARYDQKCILILMLSTRYSCHSLMKLEIFSTFFRKIFKYKISWKSVQLERSCSTRTYGRTDLTKLIVAFRNFANSPKNKLPNSKHDN